MLESKSYLFFFTTTQGTANKPPGEPGERFTKELSECAEVQTGTGKREAAAASIL